MNQQEVWAVVLAGGDGTRLRALTRFVSGEERPKQFCSLCGGATLLAQTRSRLAPAFSPPQTLFVVVKSHERFYQQELGDVTPSRLVVQPANKGTTMAVVSSLRRVASLAGNPIVAFFPTDHHYSRESQFIASVRLALDAVRERSEMVVILGATAERPEVEYGWIEPSICLACRSGNAVFRVKRFWEKPSAQIAQALHKRGCLWNTFVMIGRVAAFLDLLAATVPGVLAAFEAVGSHLAVNLDTAPAKELYASLAPGDFSRQVLSSRTENLAVLRLGDVGWSDLGTPERVMKAMVRAGHRPYWQQAALHEGY